MQYAAEKSRHLWPHLGGIAAFGVMPPSCGPRLWAWSQVHQCGLVAQSLVATTDVATRPWAADPWRQYCRLAAPSGNYLPPWARRPSFMALWAMKEH